MVIDWRNGQRSVEQRTVFSKKWCRKSKDFRTSGAWCTSLSAVWNVQFRAQCSRADSRLLTGISTGFRSVHYSPFRVQPIPSVVVIEMPSQDANGRRQAFAVPWTTRPSGVFFAIITAHAPQPPSPQPTWFIHHSHTWCRKRTLSFSFRCCW